MDGRRSGGIALDAEDELRAGENALESFFNAGFEATVHPGASLPAGYVRTRVVERHQQLQVGIGNRLAVCAAGERFNDLLCARRNRRMAGEDAAAARGIAGTFGIERTGD